MTEAPARFTRRDYLRLPEGYPAQLVDGWLVKDPAPTHWHQRLVLRLLLAFTERVGEDRVLMAPMDLILDDENVYQPDVVVFGRPVRIVPGDREVERPVIVVEVLSGSTETFDRGVKARRYLEWGVSEVWLVDPHEATIEIRSGTDRGIVAAGGVARSPAVDGLSVEVDRLFRP